MKLSYRNKCSKKVASCTSNITIIIMLDTYRCACKKIAKKEMMNDVCSATIVVMNDDSSSSSSGNNSSSEVMSFLFPGILQAVQYGL